jgi:HD superfamily phosphohydrolase
MQMTSWLMEQGLKDKAILTEIDMFSVLVAALCHDLGHDGFNNQYHT